MPFARQHHAQALLIHLRPTPSVLDIADRLERAGFEAWCVGGAIRDALLGGHPLDWDIATQATPEDVIRLFGRKRTIPVGIRFGTVSVLDDHGVAHEVTTFRRDVKTDGRHAEVEFGASLDDDLARRDLTINAIAFRPRTDELRDPYDGRGDIASGIVRAVGSAEVRMKEDRLRALRAIRFAARYGFTIESSTLAAIRHSAPHLTRLSAERVQQELVKTMEQVDAPSEALRLWRDVGAFRVLVPNLATVSDTSLRTLDFLPRNPGVAVLGQRTSNRMAALWMDCSPEEVRAAMTSLRFSKHEIAWAASMSEAWQRIGAEIATTLTTSRSPTDQQVRRWLARAGRLHASAFLRVARARWCAVAEGGADVPAASAVRSLYHRIGRLRFGSVIEVADLAIGGDELRAAGIRPGPLYAKILNALLDGVLTDPALNTPDLLMAEVRRIAASAAPGGES